MIGLSEAEEHYHNVFTEDKFNFWEYGNSGFKLSIKHIDHSLIK